MEEDSSCQTKRAILSCQGTHTSALDLSYERPVAGTPRVAGAPDSVADPSRPKRRRSDQDQPGHGQARLSRRRLYSMPEGILDVELASNSQNSGETAVRLQPVSPKTCDAASAAPESVYDMLIEHRARASFARHFGGQRGGSKARRGGRKLSAARRRAMAASTARQQEQTAVKTTAASPPVDEAQRPARRPRRAAAAAAARKLAESSSSLDSLSQIGITRPTTSSHLPVEPNPAVCRNGDSEAQRNASASPAKNASSNTLEDGSRPRSTASEAGAGSPKVASDDDGEEHHSPTVFALDVQHSDDESLPAEQSQRKKRSNSSVSTMPELSQSDFSLLTCNLAGRETRRHHRLVRRDMSDNRRNYSHRGNPAARRGRGASGGRWRCSRRRNSSPSERSGLSLRLSDSEIGSPITANSYLRSSQSFCMRSSSSSPARRRKRRLSGWSPTAQRADPALLSGGRASSLESLVVEPDPYCYRYGPRHDSRRMNLGPNLSQHISDEVRCPDRSRSRRQRQSQPQPRVQSPIQRQGQQRPQALQVQSSHHRSALPQKHARSPEQKFALGDMAADRQPCADRGLNLRLSSSYRTVATERDPASRCEWDGGADSDASLVSYAGYPPAEVARAASPQAGASPGSEPPDVAEGPARATGAAIGANSQRSLLEKELPCASLPSTEEFLLGQQEPCTAIGDMADVEGLPPTPHPNQDCQIHQRDICERRDGPRDRGRSAVHVAPVHLSTDVPSNVRPADECCFPASGAHAPTTNKTAVDGGLMDIRQPDEAALSLLCERLTSAPGGVITAELRRLVSEWQKIRGLESKILKTMHTVADKQRLAVTALVETVMTQFQSSKQRTGRMLSICSRLERLILSANTAV